ncbi:MAG: hypothetical protein H7842_09525 [Gammaproteobacteria bacterium SHHR-1]|uniref:hypothetical protein n=1 Tax=Magnetovirga frankeli TaxID=947516 RepID=UPI001293C635|nr:hypothetical protein D5125_14625 [gamma proteobacterium SS-5]
MTLSQEPKARGDQRVLQVLTEKDQQAGRNNGDPSEFMGVYSIDEEEAKANDSLCVLSLLPDSTHKCIA